MRLKGGGLDIGNEHVNQQEQEQELSLLFNYVNPATTELYEALGVYDKSFQELTVLERTWRDAQSIRRAREAVRKHNPGDND